MSHYIKEKPEGAKAYYYVKHRQSNMEMKFKIINT
jgi:hypothetical protein